MPTLKKYTSFEELKAIEKANKTSSGEQKEKAFTEWEAFLKTLQQKFSLQKEMSFKRGK